MEENLEVTGDAANFLFEKNVLSNVMYSSCHSQARTPITNTHSTLRTAPELCNNVSLAVLLGRNCNLYTVSTESDVYIQNVHNTETPVGQNRYKNWDNSEYHAPGKSFRVP